MTETKFTPGPWVLEDNPTVNGQQVAAFEKSGDMAGNRCLQVIVRSNNAADASLIAAAPELFEALAAFERVRELWLPTEVADEHAGEAEALHAIRWKMLAALSKARGES